MSNYGRVIIFYVEVKVKEKIVGLLSDVVKSIFGSSQEG